MSKFSIEIKWGILFSIVSIVWMIIEFTFGLHDKNINKHGIYSNLFAFVAIGIYYLAIRNKKIQYYNGIMSWQEGFISGMIISVIVALLSPLTQYICYTFISPNFFKNYIQFVIENKSMTKENAELYFNLKNFIISGLSFTLSIGVITSALIALILKSKNK
ncbi:MAG TPA: DUF4199 domain-containing protein [Flavobacterium sp.]|jgi:hypothetical protein|nr:DUF4199 domain-containing protein [Flavobacterium sp.]